jgi:hypothetical protein
MEWLTSRTVPISVKGLLLGVLLACAFSLYHFTIAATIHMYSDTLSDSGPGEESNHTILFTTTVPIPPNGFIRFTPDVTGFSVPAIDFDNENVQVFVDSGSGFTERVATTTPSATEDGVTIVTGAGGHIEVTLNSTTGIPANAEVRMLIGNHTTNGTSTDAAIMNPSATGTFNYIIEAGEGSEVSQVNGKYAIVDKVYVGDVDTRETDPPIRYNGGPTGDISGTTVAVELALNTDEFSRCRYSTDAETPYFSMTNEFDQSLFSVIHTKVISVSASTTYAFYVRCIDDEGNANIDDYTIGFTVLPVPSGIPGEEGETEGEGTGTGEGAGDAEDGSGDPSGDDATSGGGSTGGGGGGGGGGSGPSSGGSAGGGGLEGVNKPYQSGDAEVIISGYAFPRSKVVFLVDGKIADEVTSSANGEFSVTLEEIARGAYSFGVYGVDKNGTRSGTFSTTFTVTGSRVSSLSNIYVLPSVKVTPDPVTPGEMITVSGYTIPSATVTIENQSDKSSAGMKTFTTTSDSAGAWSTQISTSGFSQGTYKARAKAKQESGISTNFSTYTFYGVGQAKSTGGSSDLNRDSKINLTDFSILLFWWNTNGGSSNPSADINSDGKVSLTDFSILIFNWTG